MHLLQSKSLREPDFLFGFKGRELQLFATSFHPLAPVGRWQPVAALPEAGLGVMVGHRASAWAPPLPTRSRKGQGAPGPPPRAAFCPITPISEAFVRKLRGAFREPPSGAHSTRRGENNPYRFPPRGRKAARCWTLKSSQEAFSGVMASGVTWGWRVHELSTTLVQIPDLNIGPGSCQLSSVTWSPRGSSYGRHPSRCSLACAQQLLLRVLLLGSPSPAPLLTAGDALTTPSCSQRGGGELEQKSPCLVACPLRDTSHSADPLRSGLQAASASTCSSAREKTKAQSPDPHHPGPAVSYSHLHTSKFALKFAMESPNFSWISPVKTGCSLLGRGQKSGEELKLSRTNETAHSRDFSFSFKERFPKHEHASLILGMLH